MEHPILNLEKMKTEQPKEAFSTVELKEFLENDAKLAEFKFKLEESTRHSQQLVEMLMPVMAQLDAFDALTVEILELLKERLKKEKL
jgi:hypothetical protein